VRTELFAIAHPCGSTETAIGAFFNPNKFKPMRQVVFKGSQNLAAIAPEPYKTTRPVSFKNRAVSLPSRDHSGALSHRPR